MASFEDWAGDFFTGDWKNAYEANPYLTLGIPGLALGGAAAGLGLFGGGAAGAGGGLFGGLFGGGEAAALGGAEAGGLLGGEAGAAALGTEVGAPALSGVESLLANPEALALQAGQPGAAGGEGAQAINALISGGSEAGAAPIAGGETAGLFHAGGAEGAAGTSGITGEGAGGGWLEKLGTGAMKAITNNPLGTAAAAGGLAMTMMPKPDDPKRAMLEQQAAQLGQQGAMLQQYLANGTLPPALKAQLDKATAAAKARIISNHAKNGMSTDPRSNSALAQELSSVETNAVAAMAQQQIEMMKTGLNETGLSSQLYQVLLKMDRQDNTDLMNAIGNFAAALGGGTMKKAA